jgi:hypothetical protein
MSEETLNYEEWVEEALRAVIKRALDQTVLDGLLGDHHFFITFLTGHTDVKIPAHLLDEHPEKMTIVLQHQFNNLDVTDIGFSVSLSFGGRPCYMQVPFSSIVTFADPAVNFVLQLKMAEQDNEEYEDTTVSSENIDAIDVLPGLLKKKGKEAPNSRDDDNYDKDDKMGEIIALDTFRKK